MIVEVCLELAPPVGEVFKGFTVFDVLRCVDRTAPIIGEDDAVIKALVVLKALDVPALAVVNQRGKVVGVFTGYNLIAFLHMVVSTGSESLWPYLYKVSLYDVGWSILSTEPDEALEKLVSRMLVRRWGYAVVHHGETQHVIGVLDVARFLVSSGALERTSLRLLDIATGNVVSVRRDSRLFDLMGVMLDELTQYVGRPEILSGDTHISTAFKKLVEKEPYTALTEERKHILTPWDITKLLKQTS
jgi:predicted transcriptional regulator